MARVLIADDDTGCRELLELVLGDDHDVRSVDNGNAAIALARSWLPDVALLDVFLFGLSGIDVARQLRGQVRLVAFTGSTELDREQLALFDAFLLKPARPAEVRRVVAEVLSRDAA